MLSVSLFCSLKMCLQHQAGWLWSMSQPTGDTSTFFDSATRLLPSCLWMLWRCEKASGGSQLVVMNVSQSVWSLYLTSQSAQFLLRCVLRQRYIRIATGVSDSRVEVLWLCFVFLDGWHKRGPLVVLWSQTERKPWFRVIMQWFSNGVILIREGKIQECFRSNKPMKIQVSNIYSDSKMTCNVEKVYFWQGTKEKQVRLIEQTLGENKEAYLGLGFPVNMREACIFCV